MNTPHEDSPQAPEAADDFSLSLGGPLYQLYLKTRLAHPPLDLLHRRLILIPLFAWLPLLPLSLADGLAVGGVQVPFLYDIDAITRFLVALPLLIIADVSIHEHLRTAVAQFTIRGLVAQADLPRFRAALDRALQIRNSAPLEITLLIIVYTAGHWIWRDHMSLTVATWYATPHDGGMRVSLPGLWYEFVSIPLFQFMLFRWYVRLVVWYHFMWRVSRLPLVLNALHADRAGGLGFLAPGVLSFLPLMMAHSVLLTGVVANKIFYEGRGLGEFKMECVAVVVLEVLLTVLPLTFFATQLRREKYRTLRTFGALACHNVEEFRVRWLRPASTEASEPLGEEVKVLADLAEEYEVVNGTRTLCFDRESLVSVVGTALVPLVPLALVLVKPEKVLDFLLKLLGG